MNKLQTHIGLFRALYSVPKVQEEFLLPLTHCFPVNLAVNWNGNDDVNTIHDFDIGSQKSATLFISFLVKGG